MSSFVKQSANATASPTAVSVAEFPNGRHYQLVVYAEALVVIKPPKEGTSTTTTTTPTAPHQYWKLVPVVEAIKWTDVVHLKLKANRGMKLKFHTADDRRFVFTTDADRDRFIAAVLRCRPHTKRSGGRGRFTLDFERADYVPYSPPTEIPVRVTSVVPLLTPTRPAPPVPIGPPPPPPPPPIHSTPAPAPVSSFVAVRGVTTQTTAPNNQESSESSQLRLELSALQKAVAALTERVAHLEGELAKRPMMAPPPLPPPPPMAVAPLAVVVEPVATRVIRPTVSRVTGVELQAQACFTEGILLPSQIKARMASLKR